MAEQNEREAGRARSAGMTALRMFLLVVLLPVVMLRRMGSLPRRLSRRLPRRTEHGGVADEAAMIAIVLVAAVLIGGIVYTLIEQAGDSLEDVGEDLENPEDLGDANDDDN